MADTMTQTMTEAQATDEATLLLVRKLRRLHPTAFADVIKRMPADARRILDDAERRADRYRDSVGGPNGVIYPADPFADED